MFKKSLFLLALVTSSFLAGCASVPMASDEEDKARKEFVAPSQGTAGHHGLSAAHLMRKSYQLP